MNGTQLKTWRDDVSTTLGKLDERTKRMDKKLDDACKTHVHYDERMDKLEVAESNRSAVQKKMNIIYGIIISIVTAGANIAFKVFK